MDSKKFSEKQIRAGGTTGVELVSIEYKDKDYVLKTYSENKARQTGDLLIAELFSSDGKLPNFKFRWDHNKSVIDIDMFPKEGRDNKEGIDIINLWKKEKGGYKGHHPELIDREIGEYSVLIEIPWRKIFKGIIMVGILIDLNFQDNLSMSEYVNVKIQ